MPVIILESLMEQFSVSWAENEILVQEYIIYSVFPKSQRYSPIH